ncbi:hypothetical protein BUALT_Bualt19G0026800 [Buddleja alternifolia]|uniref:Protein TRIGALACTOSYLDIACYLGLYCEROL 4, chloroplastic n=1 Tax=Buddleja alternifolia TaxID=168488 RepID=A0AAV6W8Z3_9LAMI|nr:hypothetical protein BUALT_Bualt19G0026800 [Buddleja alternifolia]
MANLRTAMDASFWDLNISTPQALDGVSKAIPGDPIPLDGAKSSRAFRIQQISLLGNGFPLGIIPSFSSSANHKELGSFALQSLMGKADFGNWLIVNVHLNTFCCSFAAKVTLDAISAEGDLPNHDITLEAAWPELFIDHKGKYWEVPESISLDCSSLISDSGLRYRFGVHKNSGHPQAVNPAIDAETPLALLPGMCAKAAFSYEKSKDFWRQKETKEDVLIETDKGQFWRPAYDIRLREAHAAVSGIIGGTCSAWLGDEKSSLSSGAKDRVRLGADLFGSLCYTFQHGKFRKSFGDLTRIDTRLDIGSASALAKDVYNLFKSAQSNLSPNAMSSPKLNLIFQQQVAGPIVFRLDSKFALESSNGRHSPQLEDLIYSLNYSLRFLGSGKVVAWFSPKRKEGMVELRLFEF